MTKEFKNYCPHCIPWGEKCTTCDTEYKETLDRFCRFAGEGSKELGRQRIIEILEKSLDNES